MKKAMNFFEPVHTLWGDYGSILIAGMATYDGEIRPPDAPLQLERTGPFAPSISVVEGYKIVVTDDCKKRMMSDHPTWTFRPVTKRRIVMSDWEKWDWSAKEPARYPDESEPENYILHQPHSDKASTAMGDLWELSVSFGAYTDSVKRAPGVYVLRIHADTWNGEPIFLADYANSHSSATNLVVSDRGRELLESYDKEKLLSFEPCLTALG